MLIKPEKIKKGDTIGIVGPGSPMIQERLNNGIKYLKQIGYNVKLGKHLNDEYGYLAGKDLDRASDINQMFADPEVQAIFCTRGGYGTPRLLDMINYDLIRKNPKIFVGYSDITALQLAIYAKTGVVTFSGPMAAVEMGKGIEPFTEEHFWSMMSGSAPAMELNGRDNSLKCLKSGRAEGRLLGGCLSLICSLMGTPYLPDFTDAILLSEEIGEEPYRIDRYLTQLKLSGILNQVNGIILGQFVDCAPESDAPSLTIEQIIQDLTTDINIPILAGIPYGHIDVKYTMPIGVPILLDSDNQIVELLDNPVI